MIDVTVILLEGGLPSTSLAPLEIFGCAGTLWEMIVGQPAQPRFRVRTATADGGRTTNYVPVRVEPVVALADVPRTDLIVVPTAGLDIQAAVAQNADVVDWLAERGRGDVAFAGVCTGVSLLAAAGLLDDRRATTHWGVVELCRMLYPKVIWQPERLITESGNVFCSGGIYAAIDLSLHLVERYCDHETAVRTARSLLLEMPRTWQAPFALASARAPHGDDDVQRAENWLLAHFRSDVQLDELAGKVGMSPRNLARRFKAATGDSPLGYVHRLRIDAARQHLESSRRSVQEICAEVGYEDVAFFRKLFQRYVGTSPREYRARFGPRASSS
jgi:transcriptional regulator GlxA family with amidase domain